MFIFICSFCQSTHIYGPVVQTNVKPDIVYLTWKDKREYEEEDE